MSNEKKMKQAKEDFLALISKSPGICSVLMYDAFDKRYSRSHVLYILRAMEKELLLRLVTENGYTYCYLHADDPKSEKNREGRRRFLLQNLDRKSDGMCGKVLEVVKAEPGITKAGIAKKLDLYRNTSGYYVRLLEKHNFVQVKSLNGLKCCFTSDYTRDFVYMSGAEKELLDVIMKNPGRTEKELRVLSGQEPQALYRNLKRLLGKNKIGREKKEGRYCYFPVKTKDSEFDLFLEK
jgi:predicted transcriptional regulator